MKTKESWKQKAEKRIKDGIQTVESIQKPRVIQMDIGPAKQSAVIEVDDEELSPKTLRDVEEATGLHLDRIKRYEDSFWIILNKNKY